MPSCDWVCPVESGVHVAVISATNRLSGWTSVCGHGRTAVFHCRLTDIQEWRHNCPVTRRESSCGCSLCSGNEKSSTRAGIVTLFSDLSHLVYLISRDGLREPVPSAKQGHLPSRGQSAGGPVPPHYPRLHPRVPLWSPGAHDRQP